jgi:hypothetical protein
MKSLEYHQICCLLGFLETIREGGHGVRLWKSELQFVGFLGFLESINGGGHGTL